MDGIEGTLLIAHCVRLIIHIDCKSLSAKTVMVMFQVNLQTFFKNQAQISSNCLLNKMWIFLCKQP